MHKASFYIFVLFVKLALADYWSDNHIFNGTIICYKSASLNFSDETHFKYSHFTVNDTYFQLNYIRYFFDIQNNFNNYFVVEAPLFSGPNLCTNSCSNVITDKSEFSIYLNILSKGASYLAYNLTIAYDKYLIVPDPPQNTDLTVFDIILIVLGISIAIGIVLVMFLCSREPSCIRLKHKIFCCCYSEERQYSSFDT